MSKLTENRPDEFSEIEIELPLKSPDSKYKQLSQQSPLPVIVTDLASNFEFLSPSARKFLGYSADQSLSGKLTDIVRSKQSNPLADLNQHIQVGLDHRWEWEFLNRSTNQWTMAEVFARAAPDGFRYFYLNDLTERKQAEKLAVADEERRWQAQKSEALERLAGGIAHDFNNLLAVILLQTDMLNLQIPADSLFRHRVNEIKAVANDAAGIVRQLLAFGRKQPMNPSPVVLNKILMETAKALREKLGPEIDLEIELDPELGVCFVDPNQLAQAITYLAVNANDAMPDGGILRIETKNIMVEKGASHAAQSSGSYTQISVSDNGVGMAPYTEKHIFEPFFSTKESNKGAGLGLATVYGIVKQSGGFIWVESEIDYGTTFKIQFPRIDRPPAGAVSESETDDEIEIDDLLEIDIKTILLVDDDQAVRRIAAEILRLSGYEVLEACSGMEAIEIAQTYGRNIHMLLTDCSMPKMSGNVTAKSIRRLYPRISVLLMSGDIENISAPRSSDEMNYSYIAKPFSSSEFIRKVREVLAS